jgi:uncharacterized protein (TIGR02145 family)
MKQLLTFLFLAISAIVFSQAPQSIPYQAVVRNTDGTAMANAAVTITFKIHDNSATGTVVYEETHATTTNAQGLVSLNVGGGTAVIGTFSGIQWGTGSKFFHVLMNSGNGVVDLGTQQMMSVPYALYAAQSGSSSTAGPQGPSGTNGINALIKTSTEPAGSNCNYGGTKIETGLDVNGNGTLESAEINQAQTKFVCNGAPGSTGPQGPAGSNISSDNQQLSVSSSGDTLKLQNGGFVIIPGISAANPTANTFFNVGNGVTDIDGNFYPTVWYEGQFVYADPGATQSQVYSKMEWMAQNLRTTTYSNGDPIPFIQDNNWDALTSGAWCWYENNSNYDTPYGKLYNWYTATDTRNVCPMGWHVSTMVDWFKLTDIVYANSNAQSGSELGPFLKSQAGWSNNLNGNNASGFSAYPTGSRQPGSWYNNLGYRTDWWRVEEFSYSNGGVITLYGDYGYSNSNTEKYIGLSIRCVRYFN